LAIVSGEMPGYRDAMSPRVSLMIRIVICWVLVITGPLAAGLLLWISVRAWPDPIGLLEAALVLGGWVLAIVLLRRMLRERSGA
jgi:hypothetical protein